MLNKILVLLFLGTFLISCGDDHNDNCDPDQISFEENIIGTWKWTLFSSGKVKINPDGTYEDLEDEIVTNGELVSRNWRIEDDTLIFEVENTDGFNASVNLMWISLDCDHITFDGQGFGDIHFERS